MWLADIPVATLRPNGGGVSLFYVHTDHLNTPRRVSRPSDNVVVWRWESDPFGTTSANEDPDGDSNPFVYGLRFPGQYLDAETGLHYNYFRDYDPQTGRYPQSDPLGLKGGLNTYAYVKSNPLRYSDPKGLDSQQSHAPALGVGRLPLRPRDRPVGGSRKSGGRMLRMGLRTSAKRSQATATKRRAADLFTEGVNAGARTSS